MNNDVPKTFAQRLKYAMMIRGIDQTDLAEKIGKKPQMIQRLCAKGVRSTFSANIAEALNINVLWLTDGKGDMELPVRNEFLDRMSMLDIENRVLVEVIVEKLLPSATGELQAKIDRLGARDKKNIEMMIDMYLSRQNDGNTSATG